MSMNKKPTVKEIKSDYNKYLIKLRGYGLCFLKKNWYGDVVLINKDSLNNIPYDYVRILCDYFTNEDFIAVYKCDNEIEPITRVIQNEEPESWDWTDEAEEMTLSEICKALGKNVKIVKE